MDITLTPTKPHYKILDGLRGVAALMVVAFHIFEANATSHLDQIINHGYLAVDFFFLLSGFVIGYAYDDRWKNITIGNFFKKRLIRLQPMVILGMIIGAICFYFQDSVLWPTIHEVPLWKMLFIMVIGFTLIPVPVSMDIRGWSEMHPLNGPGWSLFFEYIANILYALFVRKFSKKLLSILVFISALALIHLALTGSKGDIIGGWSLDQEQLHIGFCRVMYPFFAGLLLFRVAKLTQIKNAFLICSILLILTFSWPRIGGEENLWMNGLYDALIVIFIFPLIVFLGASGKIEGPFSSKICNFFGDISYPIYITHYPLIYIYTGWVATNKVSLEDALPYGILTFVSSIVLAYACLKLYDEPIRKWLKNKFDQ
ncbi:Peptidoglycan/LPS O-acetylase OafA/YrhL, contains acyltransferase and SGNH-hydrolase domains [Flavobacterium glycines]|uniref:Acyltransferase n=1 Tax=Flavobacterium glycines TaxID=551990 RepID=A0A1B9DJC9_9FLAO|nr:acyltransferase [Flavobacterium glycines]OCB69816.1 acyltransferase [Flavobacterium glycines]GEL12073.1 acyltransferase [Flavobacterium glycines]SDJ89934.1 Peptidoglycan/LPS O-acetylase OafA/YrhL, contains acyltransferase and SGNH-hydrolase domains [Flavobacterium glycines]